MSSSHDRKGKSQWAGSSYGGVGSGEERYLFRGGDGSKRVVGRVDLGRVKFVLLMRADQ